MAIHIDSDEFKAWHEVGHATVCLHLGGDLDGIEFLEDDARVSRLLVVAMSCPRTNGAWHVAGSLWSSIYYELALLMGST